MVSRRLQILGWAFTIGVAFGYACSSQAQDMIAKYYDISDSGFSVEATAPRATIREYAICKAVWFAEMKKVQSVSLGDPSYSEPVPLPEWPASPPKDWVTVRTTAHLNGPSPSGNPPVNVAAYASQCRQLWQWYR